MVFDIEFDRVLAIGINYVGSRCQLNGCINDVINLKQNLKSKSYTSMTEISHDKNLLPTRQNIINAINEFTKDAKAGMNLLFQYSGHGSYTRDLNHDEADGRDETICPVDYDASGDIVDDDLRKILIDVLPEGCKLWCIFDCCHSGTVLDLKYNYTAVATDRGRKYNKGVDAHYLDSKCQVICISGCRDPQTSADAYVEKKFQGAMTWGLLKSITTLTGQKKPLTYRCIMKNLLLLMKQNGYEQIPQISSGRKLDLDSPLWS